MLVLWQWHRITAIGEDAIVKRANEILLHRFEMALAEVARGYLPVSTIKDAKDYIQMVEQGVVKEYNPIEEFIDPPKTRQCKDDLWRE